MNKREQRNQEKGSLKHLKRSAPEVKSWTDDVIRSYLIRSYISPEAEVHLNLENLKIQELFLEYKLI